MIRPKILLWACVLAVFFSGVSYAMEKNLALFKLMPTNFEAVGYDVEILYSLISVLESDDSISLMPRREMEDILFREGIAQSDDPLVVARAGKVLGINFILFGSVTKHGAKITADLKLMDIEAEQILKTWNIVFAGRDSILEETRLFAKRLSKAMAERDLYAAKRPVAHKRPDVEIENLRARSEGKKVVLRWKFDPSKPIIGFNVYRAEEEGGPYQFAGKTVKNLFEDRKITTGNDYFYRIGILLDNGTEIKSNLLAEIKNAGEKLPYPPLVLGGEGFIKRTRIKFVPSLRNEQDDFKITRYRIYRRSNPASAWQNVAEISAKISTSQSELGLVYQDTEDLEDGTTYYYAVSSIDSKKKESPLSDIIEVGTVKRPVLEIKKENLLRRLLLSWSPVENVEGYYIYRKTGSGNWERIGKIRGRDVKEYEDKEELADGTVYSYYLTAYDQEGETGPSNEVSGKTKDLPPYPEGIRLESGLVKSVRIEWEPVDDKDIGGYSIYRGDDPSAMELIKKIKGYESSSYLDKGETYSRLEDGTEYYYAIASFNLYGAEGDLSPAIKAVTKPRPRMVRGIDVETFQVPGGSGMIEISWQENPEPDIDYYLIYRKKNRGGFSRREKVRAGTTSFQDTDLRPGAVYVYQIVAVDADGLESDPARTGEIKSPAIK